MNMITARERISTFTNEISIWISCIGSDNYANFPNMMKFPKYGYPLSLK